MSSDSLERVGSGKEPIPYIGALTRVVWQWVRDQMYAGVVAAGYDDLSAAHVGLWRHPGLDGFRPTALAERAGITKQSVNDLLGYLERQGFLVRVLDPADGRARVIQLTAKGRRLGQTIYAEAQAAQMRIAVILGPPSRSWRPRQGLRSGERPAALFCVRRARPALCGPLQLLKSSHLCGRLRA